MASSSLRHHPLNNVSPLRYLKNELGQEQAPSTPGTITGILEGFTALETMVVATPYAAGAEIELRHLRGPAGRNARRLKVPLDQSPRSSRLTPRAASLTPSSRQRPTTARRG